MHSEIHFYKIICPECGAISYGFVGDNDDGSFYCDATIEMKRGKKVSTEECGYYVEKIRHMPEGSYEMLAVIEICDEKPVIKEV